MQIIEHQRGEFSISTDISKLDLGVIHEFLSQHSYWALGRPYAQIEKAIENSLCFGVYSESELVGFARVVTDFATFAWLCDVFILEKFRGLSLGKWLIESIVAHPELQGLKSMLLVTRDAHELYRKYGGFVELPIPKNVLVRHRKDRVA